MKQKRSNNLNAMINFNERKQSKQSCQTFDNFNEIILPDNQKISKEKVQYKGLKTKIMQSAIYKIFFCKLEI